MVASILKILSWLWNLFFNSIGKELMNNPIEEKETYRDISKEDNPDDGPFTDGDW